MCRVIIILGLTNNWSWVLELALLPDFHVYCHYLIKSTFHMGNLGQRIDKSRSKKAKKCLSHYE